MTQEPKMCTHVSEFVPSPRQPLIVQKIAAVGASGDRVSEGDGAHTQQGGAQHLRTHNNSGERGHRIRLRDTAIASENHGRLSPASHRADGRGASPLNRKMFGFFFLVFCCCCCCSPLPCGINRSPDCMCSLPFSVTSNSSPLSLSLSLSLSAPAVCAQRKAGARMAPCAGPASPPTLSLPLLSAEETVMMAQLLSAHHKSVFH